MSWLKQSRVDIINAEMGLMKRLIDRSKYLGYYFIKLDKPTFRRFFNYIQQKRNMSSIKLWYDIIRSVYRYNIGLMDYFIFRFYEKTPKERDKWVGTGYKYEFDLRMNPRHTRSVLENKIEFYQAYEPFVKQATCTLEDIKVSNDKAHTVLDNPTGKVVVKDSLGQCGWDVEILPSTNVNLAELAAYMQSKSFDLAEAFIQQHSSLQALSPSGLNTIRVITMINNAGEVDLLGARLRISVNSHVDNLASGNIACPVNLKTGVVDGPGVYSDITKENVTHHPVTGAKLIGFQVPLWNDVINICKEAAKHRPENRGIGWDVALMPEGPTLIEGNHNWCKILWQLPVNQGMKSVLQQYG